MSNIKVGSKMLYCKVAGDKTTEEVVEVVGIQSEAEGGGVTIYIPSLKRERDTELSRLSEIVEKKETLDTFFGKPKLVLPEFPKRTIIGTNKLFRDEFMGCGYDGSTNYDLSGNFSFVGRQNGEQGVRTEGLILASKELYSETNNLHQADEVLLDNQRLLFNQLNSLKESLKVLSQKEKKQTADDTAALSAEIKELRNLNTSLLLNQQVMAKEMQQMKAQMELMMRYMPMKKTVDYPDSVKELVKSPDEDEITKTPYKDESVKSPDEDEESIKSPEEDENSEIDEPEEDEEKEEEFSVVKFKGVLFQKGEKSGKMYVDSDKSRRFLIAEWDTAQKTANFVGFDNDACRSILEEVFSNMTENKNPKNRVIIGGKVYELEYETGYIKRKGQTIKVFLDGSIQDPEDEDNSDDDDN